MELYVYKQEQDLQDQQWQPTKTTADFSRNIHGVWERNAKDLQEAPDQNDMKMFYSELREDWGHNKKGAVHLKSANDRELFSDSTKENERWTERDVQLHNGPEKIETAALAKMPQRYWAKHRRNDGAG